MAPLAAELDALIDQNEAGLAHARRHVSDLAHALKTPLAALGVKLAERRDPGGELAPMVAGSDGRVHHHLGRARRRARRARTPLAPAVADLVSAGGRIHDERPVAAAVTVSPELVVAADAQDLDEMTGNLLDNAWRCARTTIRVDAHVLDDMVVLIVDDDGPGLSEAARAEASMPGRRLGERGNGHGFGLSIAQKLAELNGGGIELGRARRPTLGECRQARHFASRATRRAGSMHRRNRDGLTLNRPDVHGVSGSLRLLAKAQTGHWPV